MNEATYNGHTHRRKQLFIKRIDRQTSERVTNKQADG